MVYRLKGEEILACLLLIVIGYFVAKMFNRCNNGVVNGFSVGGQNSSVVPLTMEEIRETCPTYYETCINDPGTTYTYNTGRDDKIMGSAYTTCLEEMNKMINTDEIPRFIPKLMDIVKCIEVRHPHPRPPPPPGPESLYQHWRGSQQPLGGDGH